MKRFKNISLIYECDQPTLKRAALLAKDNGARLTEVNRHVQQEAKRRRESVENLLAQRLLSEYQLHLLKGDASIVIPQLVTKLNVDVLVMGTVCRTGIPDSSLAIRPSEYWTQSSVPCSRSSRRALFHQSHR